MPGRELIVCVVPNKRAKSAGLGMEKINSFTWVRVEEDTGERVEQAAIIDGRAANLLTEVTCDFDGCKSVSILKADFFQERLTPIPPNSLQTEQVASVGGIGVATVGFRKRRYRRNLLTREESWEEYIEYEQRKLQIGGGSGSFDVQLDLELQNVQPGSSSPRSRLHGCIGLLVGGVFVAALMFISL